MKLSSAKLKRVPSISPIWIVPIVALLIAASLAVHSLRQRGTEVEIVFDNASGIQVGQTQVRLKDVPVGKVVKMQLSDDLNKVRVFALLDSQVSRHLNNNSRFWLVSPRVSASGVSNLGTLISGVYIVMDQGKPGESQHVFEGLTEPPAIQSDEQGTQYVLMADTLGSVGLGSPVYYRQLKVGEVTSYRLSSQGTHVEIRIFIKAPHDKLVQENSRFWNVSGVDVNIGAEGIKAEVGSIASIINGGIAFENAIGFDKPQRAASDQMFYLFSDRSAGLEQRYTLKYLYLLKFNHSLKGVKVGAPVEFRGRKVGEVTDVKLDRVAKGPGSLHVYVSIEPERLDPHSQPTREEFDQLLENLVNEGLRARLKTANLLTGARMVDLAFVDNPPTATLIRTDTFAEFPALDDSSQDLEQQLNLLAQTVNRIPLEKMGNDLAESVAGINRMIQLLDDQGTLAKMDKTLQHVSVASEQLESTLQQAQKVMENVSDSLSSVNALVNPDAPAHYELRTMLESVQEAAESLERLTEKLNQKPNALIFGEK